MADTNTLALSLQQCIETGLARSIPLQNSVRDEEIAEGKIREVRSQLLPGLNLSASYTRLDEKPVYNDETGQDNNYQAGAGVSQLLFSGGSVSAALRAAKEYRQYVDLATTQQSNQLVQNITVSFYDLLYATSRLNVAQESLKQLQEFEKQTRIRFENDTASEFDMLSAQVKVANEKPKVISAQNALDTQREAFKNLIYLDTTDYILQGELEYIPIKVSIDNLYALALENRPELLSLQSLVAMKEQDVRATRGRYFPQLYANAGYEGRNPATESPAKDDWQWHWTAGVTLNWSVMDGGLRRSEIAQKALELDKTRATYVDLLRAIQLEVKSAYLELVHSRDVVLGTKDNVALARKALDIADVRYKNGLFTYLEFTDSNLSLTQAQLTHYEALKVYQQAIAKLIYACGTQEITRAE